MASNSKNLYRKDLVEDEQKFRLASLTFGEATGQKQPVKKMVASSVLNRLDDKKQRYGKDIDSVMSKRGAYYAVSDKDELDKNPYKQASTMQFKNVKDEKEFAKIQNMVDTISSDKKERTAGTHFFEKNEAIALKKNMTNLGSVGKYNLYIDEKPKLKKVQKSHPVVPSIAQKKVLKKPSPKKIGRR